jgi:zinc protease
MMPFRLLLVLLALWLWLLPQPGACAAEVNVITANGKEAYFIEEHSLPIVTLEIMFPYSGYAYDPQDRLGLASMVSALLNEGAGNYSRDEFKALLESSGAVISPDVGADSFSIRIKTLKEKLDDSLGLALLELLEPSFRPDMVNIVRSQMQLSLKKEKEDVSQVAYRAWMAKAFQNHPYARHAYGTEATLAKITPADLKHFIQQHLVKDHVMVSIVGDLSPEEATSLLGKVLTRLPAGDGAAEPVAEWKTFPPGERIFVPKAGVEQNAIYFGLPWVPYGDPDFYPSYVLNYTFGGSTFDSRLTKEVREKRGLVYTIDSDILNFDRSSVLVGSAVMRKGAETEVEPLINDEVKDLHVMGMTPEEMELAKQYITGSFPLMLDTSDKLTSYLDFMQRKKLGPDFLETRNSLIEAVTPEDVKRVADQLLVPGRLITVVAGEHAKTE